MSAKAAFASFLSFVAGIVFLGASAPASAGATTHSKYNLSTPQSEAAAVKSVKWTANVTTTLKSGSWSFQSDGIPASNFVATNYAVPSDPFNVSASGARINASASVLTDQNCLYTVPLTPVYSQTATTTNQGPIGFLLDGGALYNPYEANKSTVATSDNFIATANGTTASFIDTCDGHPGPGGQYHYHGLATCLVAYATGGSPTVTSVTSTTGASTARVAMTNSASKRPVVLGFAFDGYGIYDNIAMNGKTIPVSSLDACNGIFSVVPGYPRGIYHYVLENVKGVRSSISCYHGIVSSAYTQALQGAVNSTTGGGGQPGAPAQAASQSSAKSATLAASAKSLAANKNKDALLMAELTSLGFSAWCS